jgi:hypothetical protein
MFALADVVQAMDSRLRGNDGGWGEDARRWAPAFAGVTKWGGRERWSVVASRARLPLVVIPAQAGIQCRRGASTPRHSHEGGNPG